MRGGEDMCWWQAGHAQDEEDEEEEDEEDERDRGKVPARDLSEASFWKTTTNARPASATAVFGLRSFSQGRLCGRLSGVRRFGHLDRAGAGAEASPHVLRQL